MIKRFYIITLTLLATYTMQAQEYYPNDSDLDWKRNIYQKIDKQNIHNIGAFVLEDGTSTFASLLQFVVENRISVYDYTLDGIAHLDHAYVSNVPAILDNYNVSYTRDENGSISLNDAQNLIDDIQAWLIVETLGYNRYNSHFYRTVKAICPVLSLVDDSEELINYPLFWIDYNEARHLLNQLQIADDKNKANIISLSNFFDMTLYKGTTYKIDNRNALEDNASEIDLVLRYTYNVRNK